MTITNIKMQHICEADRPRERFLRDGAQSLSNQELLAIILRTGTKEESVVTIANRILMNFEQLRALHHATLQELMAIKGVGQVKAVQLLATVELAKRLMVAEFDLSQPITSPQSAANILIPELATLEQEHFVVLFLNTKNQLIHKKTIFIGSLNSSIVHPREIFKEAVKRSAACIICAHNHPSGSTKPSPEDIAVTERLKDVGEILGIELVDHLIIGGNAFLSLKERGYF